MKKVNVLSRNFAEVKSINGVLSKFVIKCCLHDDCKNGFEHFSITYTRFEKARNNRYYERGGGCGSDLYKMFPEFELICKLHLSDFRGVPMYAVENGMYHLKNSDKGIAMSYLRINEEEYQKLKYIDDKTDFKVALNDLGIVKRWKQEADECISWLLNGEDKAFVSNGHRVSQIDCTEDELKEYQNKLEKGYFSKEESDNRMKNELYAKILEKYNSRKEEIENKYLECLNEERLRYQTSKFIIDNRHKFVCPSTEDLIDSFYFVKPTKVKFYDFYSNITNNDKKLIVDFITENYKENLV